MPISYQGRTYQEGKKISWKDGVSAVATILRYAVQDDLGERNRGLAAFTALQRAGRYTKWQYQTLAPYVGSRVLELGAGVGSISTYLVRRSERIWVTEQDQCYLDILRARFEHYGNVTVGSLDPFDDAWVEVAREWDLDTVICMNVLENAADDAAVARRIHQTLRPGGRAILLVPAQPALYNALDRDLGHLRRYTASGLRRMLVGEGFGPVRVLPFNKAGTLAWMVHGTIFPRTPGSGADLRLTTSWFPLPARSGASPAGTIPYRRGPERVVALTVRPWPVELVNPLTMRPMMATCWRSITCWAKWRITQNGIKARSRG